METLRIEREGTLARLRLDKPRGNAIDEALAGDLLAALRELEADATLGGVLLCSAHPKLFCPGLDLVSLSEYDRPAMERFLSRFGELVLALYGFPRPLVAALSGHAVAGGCVLALTADLRVLRRGAQIGLNEVKVGVPLPWSVATLLRASVPPASLTRVALLGENFKDEAALEAGLVHELAGAEGFEDACAARLRELIERDAYSLATTKRYLREPVLAAMRAHESERAGEFLDGWFSDATQERIRAVVDSLASRG
jgi:enoyl-CoA hydratase